MTDEQYRSLGKVAVAYGTLELLLENVFTAIVHPKDAEVGEILLKRINSVEAMVQLVTPLLAHHYPYEDELLADWQALLPRISNAQQERNKLLHGGWLIEDDEQPEKLTKLLKKAAGEAPYTASTIEAIANEIHAVTIKLLTFLAKLSIIDLKNTR